MNIVTALLAGGVLVSTMGTTQAQVGGGVPVPGTQQPIRAGENDSPRPRDRVFFSYNYFNNVFVRVGAGIAATGNVHSGNFFGAPVSATPESDVGTMLEIGARFPLGFERTFVDGDASLATRLPFLAATGSVVVRNNDQLFRSLNFNDRVRVRLTQIQFLAGFEVLPLILFRNLAGIDLGGGLWVNPFLGAQGGVGMNVVNDLNFIVPGFGQTARMDGALRVAPVAAVSAGLRLSLDSIHPGLQGEIGYRFSYNGGIRSGGSFNNNGGPPIAQDPFRGTSYSHDVFVGFSLPFSVPANRPSQNQ